MNLNNLIASEPTLFFFILYVASIIIVTELWRGFKWLLTHTFSKKTKKDTPKLSEEGLKVIPSSVYNRQIPLRRPPLSERRIPLPDREGYIDFTK